MISVYTYKRIIIKKIIVLILFFSSLATFAETTLVSSAISEYITYSSVNHFVHELTSKGSEVNLCSYKRISKGISGSVLSVTNVPGDKFTTVLIMDKYSCNALNAESADDFSDIYTLTTLVSIHESPKGIDFKLKPILIEGQSSIDELEDGVSL
jgi:hypothetical protein